MARKMKENVPSAVLRSVIVTRGWFYDATGTSDSWWFVGSRRSGRFGRRLLAVDFTTAMRGSVRWTRARRGRCCSRVVVAAVVSHYNGRLRREPNVSRCATAGGAVVESYFIRTVG